MFVTGGRRVGVTLHFSSHSTGLKGVGVLTPRATGVSLSSHSRVSTIRKTRGVGKKCNKEEESAFFQSRTVSKQALSVPEFGSWQPGGKCRRLT